MDVQAIGEEGTHSTRGCAGSCEGAKRQTRRCCHNPHLPAAQLTYWRPWAGLAAARGPAASCDLQWVTEPWGLERGTQQKFEGQEEERWPMG